MYAKTKYSFTQDVGLYTSFTNPSNHAPLIYTHQSAFAVFHFSFFHLQIVILMSCGID